MEADGIALFETALGCCGIAWSASGVRTVQLPERDAAATRARLVRAAGAPASAGGAESARLPHHARRARDGIAALLAGADDDLADVPLDLDGVGAFRRRVYLAARAVPPGATVTYGELCDRLGEDRGAARAVGRALGANPLPIVVPCHRVTAAGGRTGGFSARGGVTTKLRLLEIERRHARGAATLF